MIRFLSHWLVCLVCANVSSLATSVLESALDKPTSDVLQANNELMWASRSSLADLMVKDTDHKSEEKLEDITLKQIHDVKSNLLSQANPSAQNIPPELTTRGVPGEPIPKDITTPLSTRSTDSSSSSSSSSSEENGISKRGLFPRRKRGKKYRGYPHGAYYRPQNRYGSSYGSPYTPSYGGGYGANYGGGYPGKHSGGYRGGKHGYGQYQGQYGQYPGQYGQYPGQFEQYPGSYSGQYPGRKYGAAPFGQQSYGWGSQYREIPNNVQPQPQLVTAR